MRKRVPLNAIRVFEATARNASVAKAADELCVTPTAVSHQIRQLEEFLQTQLFIRKNSRIELTSGARASMERLSRALDLINDAVLELEGSAEDESRRLSVSASVSVASHWLMPKLSAFMRMEPDIDLNVRTFLSRKDAESQDSDLRILNWQTNLDCQVEPLLEEEIVPVCTPELAAMFDNNPREILRNAPMIHVDRQNDTPDGKYPDWARYLGEFGVLRGDLNHGARFNQGGTATEAAVAGVGVLLGRSLITAHALETGRLVRVAESYPIRSPYFMLSGWKSYERAAMRRFKDWLLSIAPARNGLHAI